MALRVERSAAGSQDKLMNMALINTASIPISLLKSFPSSNPTAYSQTHTGFLESKKPVSKESSLRLLRRFSQLKNKIKSLRQGKCRRLQTDRPSSKPFVKKEPKLSEISAGMQNQPDKPSHILRRNNSNHQSLSFSSSTFLLPHLLYPTHPGPGPRTANNMRKPSGGGGGIFSQRRTRISESGKEREWGGRNPISSVSQTTMKHRTPSALCR